MSRTNALVAAILSLILGARFGWAQGVYLTANAGYALGAGTQVLDIKATSSTTGPTTSYEGVFGSFGEGSKFGASAGYMFNKNLGVELGLSYWLGKTFELSSPFATTSEGNTSSGSGFVALPSIVVSANMEKINPYARLGVVLGILKVKRELRAEASGQTFESTLEETGGLAFGYAGALGFVVPASGTVDLFVEVALHSVTYSPDQEEVTRYTLNGVDQLATITDKVYQYKESYTSNEQHTSMAVRRPFSSIGMVVGARINL